MKRFLFTAQDLKIPFFREYLYNVLNKMWNKVKTALRTLWTPPPHKYSVLSWGCSGIDVYTCFIHLLKRKRFHCWSKKAKMEGVLMFVPTGVLLSAVWTVFCTCRQSRSVQGCRDCLNCFLTCTGQTSCETCSVAFPYLLGNSTRTGKEEKSVKTKLSPW